MNVLRFVTVEEICRRGSVRDSDVALLRRALDRSQRRTTQDADALFRMHGCCPVRDPAWADFFIETVTDFLIREMEPTGYLTSEQAAWLIERLAPGGAIETKTELDLLLNVVDKARWAPESLIRFALDQIRAAVVSGKGPLRAGTRQEPGRILDAEVEWLRELLFAFGGDGNVPITRTEGELLFAIQGALAEPDTSKAWFDTFTAAAANCVLSASGYAVPSREEALRRHFGRPGTGEPAPGSAAELLSEGPRGLLRRYRRLSADELAMARLERQRIEIITREPVSAGEADWLARLLGRDCGSLAERAILDFIHRERGMLHPELQALAATRECAA